MTYTQITLIGNVGKDPELRFTSEGRAVANFSLAVSQGFGERKETVWWKVVVWGQQAETVNQYVKKGSQVLVSGDRIKADAYMSKEGEARASLELTANTVRFLGGRGESEPEQAEMEHPF